AVRFRRDGKAYLHLVLVDRTTGVPIPALRFKLEGAGVSCEATTDEDGEYLHGEDVAFGEYKLTAGDEVAHVPAVRDEADRHCQPLDGTPGDLFLKLVDRTGSPVADKPYRLEVRGGAARPGTTTSAGTIRTEGIPAGVHNLVVEGATLL